MCGRTVFQPDVRSHEGQTDVKMELHQGLICVHETLTDLRRVLPAEVSAEMLNIPIYQHCRVT